MADYSGLMYYYQETWDSRLSIKRIVHELKFFLFLKIPSYKSNLL